MSDRFWFRATLITGEKTKPTYVTFSSGAKAIDRAAKFAKEGMVARLQDDQQVFVNSHYIAYVAYGREGNT